VTHALALLCFLSVPFIATISRHIHGRSNIPASSELEGEPSMQNNPDAQALLARMRAGEQAAVGELYDLYGGMIYALAHRLTRDAAEAEEIVLGVFMRAWREALAYDARNNNLTKWLVTLTGHRITLRPPNRQATGASAR
jgi:Sigma-70 region 2